MAVALTSASGVCLISALRFEASPFYSAVALLDSHSNRANTLKCHSLEERWKAQASTVWTVALPYISDVGPSWFSSLGTCLFRLRLWGSTYAVSHHEGGRLTGSFIEKTNSLANNLLYRFPSCIVCSFPLLRFVFICLTKKSYDLKPFWRSLCFY